MNVLILEVIFVVWNCWLEFKDEPKILWLWNPKSSITESTKYDVAMLTLRCMLSADVPDNDINWMAT